MIDDVLKIPGNEAAYQRLLDRLHSREAVAFVGAGASMPLYPSWEKLVGKLADQAGAHGATEVEVEYWKGEAGADPLETVEQIAEQLTAGRFCQTLAEIFARKTGDDGRAFTATHERLLRLPFCGFATTNYDLCLSEARSDVLGVHQPLPFTWESDQVSFWADLTSPDAPPILHAHGMQGERSSMVLTASSYREAYRQGPWATCFADLWRGGRLVFVGFGFSDPWIGFLADRAITDAGVREVTGPGHVAIFGVDEADLAVAHLKRKKLEARYHANVLFYPIVDGSHDALGKLLDAAREALDAPEIGSTSVKATETTVRDRWLDLVAEEHRRLTDHFDRPAELSLLETAWVRLELSRSAEGRADREGLAEEMLHDHSAPGRSTLDTYLDFDRTDPANRWVTGRWLVEGDPGSGKTTLLRYLTARRAKATRAGGSDAVPLFLSLPKLTEPLRMPLDFVRDEVGGTCGDGLVEVLDAAGRDGRLLVLLDALDEVPPERRDRVGKVLARIATDWPDATVVMSSRPIGQGDVSDSFDFVKLDLQPLDPEQRVEFLSKWFGSETTADIAAKHFNREESLRALSFNPLHLTLLAVLWERGIEAPRRRSELYDEILAMLLAGKHREKDKAKAMEPKGPTREILRGLAWAHTVDDVPSESRDDLADRLLDDDLVSWRDRVRREWPSDADFLDAVAERTYILAPHDGQQNPWRFWHRTLREALTAERLDQIRRTDGEDTILERVEALKGDDEGRWAEPFALLAGQKGSGRLIVELTRRRPSLGVRALETAQGLSADTLVEILGALEHPSQRGAVYEAIPSQLDDPDAALDLVDRLRQQTRNGNDLFFLDLACRWTGDRWPAASDAAAELRGRLYDHIAAPPADLFRRFTTPQGETKDLWCTIPAGVYSIGSDDHHDDEKPRHPVEIVKPYAMAAVTVTNAQYAAFDPAKAPRKLSGAPDHPRVDVTWWEAMSFCRWLATLRGFEGARLPSEEEWEVACRAGSTTEYWNGDGPAALDPIGWHRSNSGDRTHRVGGKLPNPWGLYDVHGNVREWASTKWDEKRYRDRSPTKPFPVDPTTPPADLAEPRADRVIRGGCVWYTAVRARSAYRYWDVPGTEFRVQGFRVLLPSPEDL